jgi:hypothetical protein
VGGPKVGVGGSSVHLESDTITDGEPDVMATSAVFTWSEKNPMHPEWRLKYGTSPREKPFDRKVYWPHKVEPVRMARDAVSSWKAQMAVDKSIRVI